MLIYCSRHNRTYSFIRVAIWSAGFIVIFSCPAVAGDDETQGDTPLGEKVEGANRELEKLQTEAAEAGKKYMKLIAEVRPTLKSREERTRLVIENDPSYSFAMRALALAEKNPKTVVGVLSLRFVLASGYTSLNTQLVALKKDAIVHLEENYIGEKWFWAYLPTISLEAWLCDITPFLRSCLEKSPHREVRGQACFRLADQTLRRQRFLNRRGQKLRKQQEQELIVLLDRCVNEFADLPTARTTIGKAAGRSLFEIRNLSVGKSAPRTVGEDLDGVHLDLSDYHGQVVMLSFWGDWCTSCRRLLRDEQSLVEEFRDRPFVLLGVNSDPRGKARTAIEREKITWRSWWDGGNSSGPISATWNVTAWPTIYIVDDKGVIRFRYFSKVSKQELEKAIDGLLLKIATR